MLRSRGRLEVQEQRRRSLCAAIKNHAKAIPIKTQNTANEDLKEAAFVQLVELQDQATIDRALSGLLGDDGALATGEQYYHQPSH